MKIAYKDPKNLRKDTKILLDNIIRILEDYESQGYKLTLRQLYYQLVSSDILENKVQNYAKLSRILTDARLSGFVDWDIIEDRIRVPQIPSNWSSIQHLVNNATAQYRKDRHENQLQYVEVWVEKDALSGILLPITNHYHINLMVNRGYSSITAMFNASQRLQSEIDKGKECTILYLGDHDPSGLDMIRDIKDRMETFRIYDLEITQIALTQAQIKKYNPPPNPAKENDPRAKWYIEQFGNVSWELDALKPDVLNKLLQSEIESLVDMDLYNEVIEQEESEKEQLVQLAEELSQ